MTLYRLSILCVFVEVYLYGVGMLEILKICKRRKFESCFQYSCRGVHLPSKLFSPSISVSGARSYEKLNYARERILKRRDFLTKLLTTTTLSQSDKR